MKVSVLLLSVCGICVFYVCYPDWLDELFDRVFEAYLGTDCEEVAPFISSVASGTEEFDRIVAQFQPEPSHGTGVDWCVAAAVLVSLAVLLFAVRFAIFDRIGGLTDGEPRWSGGAVLRRKGQATKCGSESLRVIWRGNEPFKSSVHCSLAGEEKCHGEGLQSKSASVKDRGGGDDAEDVTPSSSNDSTLHRIREIREILESEPDEVKSLQRPESEDFPDRLMAGLRQKFEGNAGFVTNDDSAMTKGNAPSQAARNTPCNSLRQEWSKAEEDESGTERSGDSMESESDKDVAADPKLMHRIKLLENKLRVEEMKNRNWISRMSRAEEILQQLNKQVERIEQDRTVETLTKTLRITSTVTNWMPTAPAGKSLQFTLSKIYYPQYPLPQQTSLSEIIKREVGFPGAHDIRRASSPQRSPPLPVLPPRGLLLRKFLSK